jgi:eukaryotic-like serine/threonine-protein kinase
MSGETLLNNRYRLVAQQGSGGMAVIYKALDTSLGRTVAIKILRPSLTAEPQFIARFQNEARSIANLSHPNIVTVHDVGSDGPTNFMVMEFVEGSDLKKVIRSHGTLSVEKSLHYAIGMCAGLGFAHRSRIVHADVKPQNVLVNKSDEVKITDFGIAQALSDTQPAERASVVWGSPHYFAPEQAQGEKPSAASDVYSIGIVLFEMLTGRLPYTGANQQELAMAHIRTAVPLANEVNPAVPDELARIIAKVMSKNPNDRYSQADQLGRVLISYRNRITANTMQEQRSVEEVDSSPSSLPERSSRGEAPQTPPPPQQSGSSPYRRPTGQPQTPPPPESPATQRSSPAPNAPQAIDYQRRPGVPSPQQGNQAEGGFVPSPATQGRFSGDSGPLPPYKYSGMRSQEDDDEPIWDGVTIALAFLALTSVACLIPLYIFVFSARI